MIIYLDTDPNLAEAKNMIESALAEIKAGETKHCVLDEPDFSWDIPLERPTDRLRLMDLEPDFVRQVILEAVLEMGLARNRAEAEPIVNNALAEIKAGKCSTCPYEYCSVQCLGG